MVRRKFLSDNCFQEQLLCETYSCEDAFPFATILASPLSFHLYPHKRHLSPSLTFIQALTHFSYAYITTLSSNSLLCVALGRCIKIARVTKYYPDPPIFQSGFPLSTGADVDGSTRRP